MKILGLDISSSKIGIALLNGQEILISEVLKFKPKTSLEERAEIFEQRMRQIMNNTLFMMFLWSSLP